MFAAGLDTPPMSVVCAKLIEYQWPLGNKIMYVFKGHGSKIVPLMSYDLCMLSMHL